MNQMENLRERIEKEREKLDRLTLENDLEATYQQSLVLDRLVEEISGPSECLKKKSDENPTFYHQIRKVAEKWGLLSVRRKIPYGSV